MERTEEKAAPYDVVIVGGGPAGLSAALTLGRGCKRALLCDSGPRRNAAAKEIHNFVTRDGITPAEFRRVAREQLGIYENIEVRDIAVESIVREGELFTVRTTSGTFEARRVLLTVGVVDVITDLPGYRELWGKSIFQCPYCHGWEVRDSAFGVLATSLPMVEFAFILAAWSRDLVVFTGGAFPVPADLARRLEVMQIRLDERPIRALHAREGHLEAVELAEGERVKRDVLFARPQQKPLALVEALGLTFDDLGYVRVDEQKRTSAPGIYAAGDLTTPMQSAVMAAAAGAIAAAMIGHGLSLDAVEREVQRRQEGAS